MRTSRFSAGVEAATIGVSDAWLLGPALATTLKWSSGQRLSLGAAWLAGKSASLEDATARWLEGNLAFAQAFGVAPGIDLDLGLAAAIASVRLSDEGALAPLDTWSSRAGAFARVDVRLGPHLGISVGPDVGVVLRPLTLDGFLSGDERRLGGPWLGGTLSAFGWTLTLHDEHSRCSFVRSTKRRPSMRNGRSALSVILRHPRTLMRKAPGDASAAPVSVDPGGEETLETTTT